MMGIIGSLIAVWASGVIAGFVMASQSYRLWVWEAE